MEEGGGSLVNISKCFLKFRLRSIFRWSHLLSHRTIVQYAIESYDFVFDVNESEESAIHVSVRIFSRLEMYRAMMGAVLEVRS